MTGIIILNWNGWRDTIECLRSLYKTGGAEFFCVVVDNGSTDGSVEKIIEFISKSGNNSDWALVREGGECEYIRRDIPDKFTVIYSLKENNGFAKGNNMGIDLARRFQPKYLLLLNNDTEVEPDFLVNLIRFQTSHPEYCILTPVILYFSDKSRVWNCGGKLCWGFRRYFYGNQKLSRIKEKDFIECEFVTGCALFIRADKLHGENIFTERFFHGEEDFELSYRMKKSGQRMACVIDSRIFHKVGISTKTMNSLGKSFIYYLNRYINMRSYMSNVEYKLWKSVYKIYIFLSLYKRRIGVGTIIGFLRLLDSESKRLDSVDRAYFMKCLKSGFDS